MNVIIANASHRVYADVICKTIEESAQVRGTGIARRTPEYILKRIDNGNAVIALDGYQFVGFCYIEQWGHGKFVANSGLIVHPDYRGKGVAKLIKKKIFEHSRTKFPDAKVFSITTGLAVMKMNSELGYKPVTFSELTDDQEFWKGCQTCRNYDILQRTNQSMCMCTGMLYDPNSKGNQEAKKVKLKVFQRLVNMKRNLFLKKNKK